MSSMVCIEELTAKIQLQEQLILLPEVQEEAEKLVEEGHHYVSPPVSRRTSMKHSSPSEDLEEQVYSKKPRYSNRCSLVRFDDQSTQYIEPRYKLTLEDRSKVWYSRDELREIRNTVKQGTRTYTSENDSLLSEIYTSRDEETDFETASKLYASELLAQRGLEKLLSRHHLLARCVTMIHSRSEVTLGRTASQKALGYRQAARPAARFARVLGIVDQLVSEAENNRL